MGTTNDDPRCSKPKDCKRNAARNRRLCKTCLRRSISAAANSVRHRYAIAQAQQLYQRQFLPTGIFSMPIKVIAANDRILIDRYLAERASC